MLQSFLTLVATMYPLSRLLGYCVMFVIVVVVMWQKKNAKRYLGRPFRTDVAHSLWFPVYAFLIAVPLSLELAHIVTAYAPFLRLHLLSGQPAWLSVLVWFVVSDFSQYWLHRSLHRWRWLWVLHKVHHSQRELNPLTAWRVHWLEFVYLNLGAFAVSLPLGDFTGYHAVVVGILAASQMAQHSDLNWSYGPLGKLFVNPRFHSWHHSIAPEDRDLNFGTSLVIWDHLFGTARNAQAAATAHGLLAADDGVPNSFLGQQLYPLSSFLWRWWANENWMARRDYR